MILVTVGTAAFDDLVRAVDEMGLGEEVVFQIGRGRHLPKRHSYFRFKPSLHEEYAKAGLVLSHAGAGTLLELCRMGKKVIVIQSSSTISVPDLRMKLENEGWILVCPSVARLPEYLDKAREWRPKPYIEAPCGIAKAIAGVISPLPDRGDIVFLAWAPYSQRAKTVWSRLGARVFLISSGFKRKLFAPLKYPLLFVRSLCILMRERPRAVICQDPPLFCALAALLHKGLGGGKTRVILDAHTGAFDKPWIYLKPVMKWMLKRADGMIVTNAELQDLVARDYGIKPSVLEDGIPEIPMPARRGNGENSGDDGGFDVAVISSFAPDEPVEAVLKAAAGLPKVRFHLTGDHSRADRRLFSKGKPDNVILTGFLREADYAALLQEADAVMALTKRDRTMLGGACEAVALEKPLITSHWSPLKRYFSKGTIHVDNSPAEIQAAVEAVQRRRGELQREMAALKAQRTQEWEARFNEFKRGQLIAVRIPTMAGHGC